MKIDYYPLPAIVDDGENGGGPYTLHPRDSMIDSIIIQRSSYYQNKTDSRFVNEG